MGRGTLGYSIVVGSDSMNGSADGYARLREPETAETLTSTTGSVLVAGQIEARSPP